MRLRANRSRRMWVCQNAARAASANSPVGKGRPFACQRKQWRKEGCFRHCEEASLLSFLAIETIHGDRNTAPYTSAKTMTYAGWMRHLPSSKKALAAISANSSSAIQRYFATTSARTSGIEDGPPPYPSMPTRKKARNKCHWFIEVIPLS